MVHIPVQNQHPPHAPLFPRYRGRHGDVVEQAKAHSLVSLCVVAGRPHEGKNRSALRDRVTSGREGGGGGATGVVADVLEEGGVRVEVAGLREALEMRGRVREEERGIGHRSGGRRHAPFPGSVSGAEVRGGAEDAGRLLRAQRGAVVLRSAARSPSLSLS